MLIPVWFIIARADEFWCGDVCLFTLKRKHFRSRKRGAFIAQLRHWLQFWAVWASYGNFVPQARALAVASKESLVGCQHFAGRVCLQSHDFLLPGVRWTGLRCGLRIRSEGDSIKTSFFEFDLDRIRFPNWEALRSLLNVLLCGPVEYFDLEKAVWIW